MVQPKMKAVFCLPMRFVKYPQIKLGQADVLGLELEDAIKVAEWLGGGGISSVSYPEEKMRQFVFPDGKGADECRIVRMTHMEFCTAIQSGQFPTCWLRRPLSKNEKRDFLKTLEEWENKTIQSTEPSFVLTKCGAESLPSESKEINMYYIVNVKANRLLTDSLEWIPVLELQMDNSKQKQLFCVANIDTARTVILWLVNKKGNVAPYAAKTVRKKYNLKLPVVQEDSLAAGLKSGKYPDCLGREPKDKKEVIAFRSQLHKDLKDFDRRRSRLFEDGMKWAGSMPDISEDVPTFAPLNKKEKATMNALIERLNLEYSENAKEIEDSENPGSVENPAENEDGKAVSEDMAVHKHDRYFFHYSPSSVMYSSGLICKMISASVSFRNILLGMESMLSRKKADLVTLQKKLIDLDHISEFCTVNAADGYRIHKARQDTLRQRRILKDEIVTLELASNYFTDDITPEKLQSFVNSVMKLDKRMYVPKVMTSDDVKDIIKNPKTVRAILGQESTEQGQPDGKQESAGLDN